MIVKIIIAMLVINIETIMIMITAVIMWEIILIILIPNVIIRKRSKVRKKNSAEYLWVKTKTVKYLKKQNYRILVIPPN